MYFQCTIIECIIIIRHPDSPHRDILHIVAMRSSWIWTSYFRLSEARDKPSETRAAVQLNTKGQTHKICSSYVDARIAPKKSRV
jgi:hypothetical protein